MARARARTAATHTGPGPGTGTGSGGTSFFNRSIVWKGVTYSAQIFIPTGYNAAIAYPVILDFGNSGTQGSDNTSQVSGANTLAQKLLVPQVATWPCITICMQMPAGVPYGFLAVGYKISELMLRAVQAEWHTDRTRVYMTGASEGCTIALAMACIYPHLFAGILCASGICDNGALDPFLAKITPSTTAQGAIFYKSVIESTLPIRLWIGSADATLPTIYVGATGTSLYNEMVAAGFSGNVALTLLAGGTHSDAINAAYLTQANFDNWLFTLHR